MTDRRRVLQTLMGAACVLAPHAWAQQATLRRVGFLQNAMPTTPDTVRLQKVFTQALEERGWVEGRNVVYERRYVEGRVERIPAFAAELVQAKCDVIVVSVGDVAVRALKELTTTIPIVMSNASDPVRDGFVASLARPGGNITGVTSRSLDVTPKRLEFLKAAAPAVTRVIYLTGRYGAAGVTGAAELQRNREAAAKAIGVDVVRLEMPAPRDFDSVGPAILRERGDALLLAPNATNFILRNELGEFALRHRLPAIGDVREQAAAGLLMSYGVNLTWSWRTVAAYVDKILRGAKPADLAIEQATFELVINLATAKAIGLTIPQSLLLRADEVIQ